MAVQVSTGCFRVPVYRLFGTLYLSNEQVVVEHPESASEQSLLITSHILLTPLV